MSLDGKVVLVTGAARGIGAAVARAAAARGARVALAGLEPEALAAVAAELGPGHAWFECDVTDQAALERAADGAAAALGGIDAVVANAGIAPLGTVAVTPPDALARVIDVNLTGVVRTVSATLPHVRARRGHYLLVSSAAAIAALPGLAVYAATKIGVEHFATALRLELAPERVGVGVAYPSWIDTDLVRDVARDLPGFEALRRSMPGPFSSVTPVEECADALVDAIERRRRKVYVPRSLAWVAPLRTALWSRLGDLLVRRGSAGSVRALERGVDSLGRSFGRSSVETSRRR